ncbi:MAG: signal peptidase II [Candidatus Omnitrophota bacterium]
MIFFYALVGAVVFIDQLSKFLALQYLSPYASVLLIPHVLDLTLVKNSGVAFGLLSGYAPALFTVITISLVCLFLIANRSHGTTARLRGGSPSSPQEREAVHGTSIVDRWALSLILGGAIGNWIDRLRFGAVIDFIDFRIFPVFNIADTAITIGVGLYFIHVFTSKDKT